MGRAGRCFPAPVEAGTRTQPVLDELCSRLAKARDTAAGRRLFACRVALILGLPAVGGCGPSESWRFSSESRPLDRILLRDAAWTDITDAPGEERPDHCPVAKRRQENGGAYAKALIAAAIHNGDGTVKSASDLDALGFRCAQDVCRYAQEVTVGRRGFSNNAGVRHVIEVCVKRANPYELTATWRFNRLDRGN